MIYIVVAIVIAVFLYAWNARNEKIYGELSPLKEEHAKDYPLFQAIIDQDLKKFKILLEKQGPDKRNYLLSNAISVSSTSYLIVTKPIQYFNLFETAFRHQATDIVNYLMTQGASRQMFLNGLRSLNESEQKNWLDRLRTFGPPTDLSSSPQNLYFVIEMSAGHSPIMQYLKDENLELNPKWYDESWKKDKSLMREFASQYNWKKINLIWPYLSSSQKKQAQSEIAELMKKYEDSLVKENNSIDPQKTDFEEFKKNLN